MPWFHVIIYTILLAVNLNKIYALPLYVVVDEGHLPNFLLDQIFCPIENFYIWLSSTAPFAIFQYWYKQKSWMIYFSVPFGERFFYFSFPMQKSTISAAYLWEDFYKEGVNKCHFRDLPVEEKISISIATFACFCGLSMRGWNFFSKKPKLFSFLWPTNEGVRRISHFIAVFGTSRGLSMRGDIKTKRRCFLWFWFAALAMIQWLEELFPCDRVGGG